MKNNEMQTKLNQNILATTEFLLAVMDMRRFQKEYFLTRSGTSLQSAKKAERKVDKLIEDFQNGHPRMEQGKLC